MPTIPLYANTELVVVAWLKELTAPGMVGTTLPTDVSTWADTGFIQVTGLTDTSDPYVGMVHPAVSIDTWGAPKGNKPPWGKTNNLQEFVRRSCLKLRPGRIALPGDFPEAQLYTAQMVSGPRRVLDPGSFARYNSTVMFHWAPVSLT